MVRSPDTPPSAPLDLPAQREADEDERGYDPVRDERGRELPYYYNEYEPVSGADARTQEAINRVGSRQVRAVLAALKEAKQRKENNTSV